jgi:hypothetical protein
VLALDANRKLDERRRARSRGIIPAGAGGVAVGVHTTQFEIRDPHVGLYQPVLALAMEELARPTLSASPVSSAGTQAEGSGCAALRLSDRPAGRQRTA